MKLGEVKSKERYSSFKEGIINFRASQVGRCIRSLFYSMTGVEQDPVDKKTRKMWNERLVDEEKLVSNLRKKHEIIHTGRNQVTYYRRIEGTDIVISSTPDGMLKDEGELIPLEIKSLNPFKFFKIQKQSDLSRDYQVQVTCEMIATGMNRAMYVVGNARDKSNEDFKEFIVTKNSDLELFVEKRIERLVKKLQNKTKTVAPEWCPGSSKCRWCLYKSTCKEDIYKFDVFSYQKEIELNKTSSRAEKYLSLVQDIKVSQEEIRDLQQRMLEKSYEILLFLDKKKAKKVKIGRKSIEAKDFSFVEALLNEGGNL